MSRGYRQHGRRLEAQGEAVRQRALAAQAAHQPGSRFLAAADISPAETDALTGRSAEPSPLFQFATELTRSHARELILSQPAPLFGAPNLATPRAPDEIFTEGRVHRRAPAPCNYHNET